MKNLMDKLSTYAALVGVIGAIGGGFYAWGEFNTRLSSIEGSGVDISGIEKNGKQIAVIEEKIGKLDLSGIAVVEKGQKDNSEAIKENEEWIEEVEIKANETAKENAVLKKELELLKLEIQELKLKAQNPLAG
jgi:hypothetical protein